MTQENKQLLYESLQRQLKSLIDEEPDFIANLANASALLNNGLDKVNWVGFYLWKDEELVLGPFQGLPACIRIPYGKGVCGTAVKERRTIVVPDVDAFPGHIVCDEKSKSEIVIPLVVKGEVFAVLDIDSPVLDRFDPVDQAGLEGFVSILEAHFTACFH